MSNLFNYNDPIIPQWRDTIKEITETRSVYNNSTYLTEIPDESKHVQIANYTEIFPPTVPSSNQFAIDYKTGLVSFGGTVANGTSVSAHYFGKGVILFPASRVTTNTTNPDAPSNIQDMIDNYNNLNNVDIYTKFDPNSGHKHTGQAGDAPPIPAVNIPISDSGNLITATEVEGAIQEVQTNINNNNNKIGLLTDLQTTDKSSVVAAVNENTSQLAEKALQTDLDTTNTNLDYLKQQLVPKRYVFGGQLENIKYALSNPLEQFMSIVFIGDSITWGYQLSDSGASDPRDGTLSDPRSVYASPNFVNLFKQYIGSKYTFNTTPTLSNWAASPSGESIATFEKDIILFPYGGDFTWSSAGTITTAPTVQTSANSLCGTQLYMNVGSAQNGVFTLEFTFTGKEFTLSYDSVSNGIDYELFVDGVSQGIFHSYDGGSDAYDHRRAHTFGYVKDKLIQIKTVKTAYSGTQTFKIGGIIFPKTIQISNQGIIGADTRSYLSKNLDGNTSGDGVAVSSEDNYVIVQLGTNDRNIFSGVPKGVNEFKKNLNMLLDSVSSLTTRQIVLMCANPAANESTTSHSFNMQDTRNAIYMVAKNRTLDFIDNYSIFGDVNTTIYTVDGLHPNNSGHEIISRNIINCLEFN